MQTPITAEKRVSTPAGLTMTTTTQRTATLLDAGDLTQVVSDSTTIDYPIDGKRTAAWGRKSMKLSSRAVSVRITPTPSPNWIRITRWSPCSFTGVNAWCLSTW
jgi:hypothetical protein